MLLSWLFFVNRLSPPPTSQVCCGLAVNECDLSVVQEGLCQLFKIGCVSCLGKAVSVVQEELCHLFRKGCVRCSKRYVSVVQEVLCHMFRKGCVSSSGRVVSVVQEGL